MRREKSLIQRRDKTPLRERTQAHIAIDIVAETALVAVHGKHDILHPGEPEPRGSYVEPYLCQAVIEDIITANHYRAAAVLVSGNHREVVREESVDVKLVPGGKALRRISLIILIRIDGRPVRSRETGRKSRRERTCGLPLTVV